MDKKDTILDGQGILACPGFINSHTHVGDSVGKDIGVNFSFNGRVHPVQGIKKRILDGTDRETLVKFVRGSLFSMMNKGIVAFADFREGGPEGVKLLKDAISDLPIKCMIFGRVEYYLDPSKKGRGRRLEGIVL